MSGIKNMKQLLAMKCSSSQENQEDINKRMEHVVQEATCKENYSISILFIDSHKLFSSQLLKLRKIQLNTSTEYWIG